MGYKSYSQKKRESYDYRTNYIKHNPGLFGGIYVCSQCFKRLSRGKMEVDHIFPVSKWYAPNRVFNCVAICSSCNKKKSNKVETMMTVKAIIAKILEELIILLQLAVVWGLRLLAILIIAIIRMAMRPLFTDRSLSQKGFILGLYSYIIFSIF